MDEKKGKLFNRIVLYLIYTCIQIPRKVNNGVLKFVLKCIV